MYDEIDSDSIEELVRAEPEREARDLVQLRSIVADAVAQLGTGFDEIAAQAGAQQKLLVGLLTCVDGDQSPGGSMASFVTNSEALVARVAKGLAEASQRTLYLVEKLTAIDNAFRCLGTLSDSAREISQQIRVLAFNARLEATRAGGAGRGFSVVADSVGQLSRSYRTLTEQIQDTVDQARTSLNETIIAAESAAVEDRNTVESARGEMSQLHDEVEELNSEIGRSLQEARRIGEAIQTGVNRCVRALQFDDLVGQLCDAGRRRANACTAVSSSLECRCRTDVEHSQKENALLTQLQLLSAAQNRSVQQPNLGAGDVELF